MIPGVKINLGGDEYIVPPLNFRQLEKHSKLLDELPEVLATGEVKRQWQIILTLALAALSRNYPELTLEKLKDIIDLGNLGPLTEAVMGQAGFKESGELMPEQAQS
jgi:hypothetical protein